MKMNPLLDSVFLRELDTHRNRVTYARITNLTTSQYPIERIEGVITGGSITIDGDSAVRRICSLTLTTSNLNINNIYWSLTTRVKIEIGIENNLAKKYGLRNELVKDYQAQYGDIIWFPQGVFVLTDFKTSATVNSYSISLQGKDKMCLLNGDVGGKFNAETQIDSERVEQEDGTWEDEKKPIAYILRELVHTYAQEPFHNIIIKDIDTLSLKVLRNRATTFYLVKKEATEEIVDMYYDDPSVTGNSSYRYYDDLSTEVNFKRIPSNFIFDTSVDEDDLGLIHNPPSIIIDENNIKYTVVRVSAGEDLGYEITETYYPEELIAGVGETVTSVFDKIINTFGEFEYFYNLDGQFVFQGKQTYVNTAWNNVVYNDENEFYVAPSQVSSKVVYSFDSNVLTTAYQNTPQLGSIKNDFTVWGKKKTTSNIEIPIHMRYAIDKMPEYYHSFSTEEKENGIIYVTSEFYNQYLAPMFGEYPEDNMIEEQEYRMVDWREIIYQMAIDYYKHNHDDDYEIMLYRNNKNSLLNLSFYEQGRTGYEQYYQDIEGFWRLLYAPEDWLQKYNEDNAKNPNQIVDSDNFYNDDGEFIGPWNKMIADEPQSLLFWFDFYNSDALGLGQFSVPAIGHRPENESNDNIRALVYKDIPDVIFITQEDYDKYKDDNRFMQLDGYSFIVGNKFIEDNIENDKISLSTRSLTAHEEIDSLLYNNAYCKETITITSLPIYYLEPNTIISAKDVQRNINGYYIINKITLPLDYKGTMQITAIKVPERIY